MQRLAPIAKALVAGLAAGASYLIGVMGAEDTLGDVTTVQWLGLIPVVAAAYGITWRVPNRQLETRSDPLDDIVHLEPQPLEVRSLEERTLFGRIVPYGETIQYRGRSESFAKGAFAGIKPERVRLLDHHDMRRPIGRMIAMEERADGLYGTFQVAKTPRGDELLQLAAEGVIDSFSPGFVPGDQTPDGVHVRVKDMPEVSLVTFGAYPGAKVLAVREREAPMPPESTTEEPEVLTPEDIEELQTRQDEMLETLSRIQASIESGAVQTRNAPRPPTSLDWFRAKFAAHYDQDRTLLDRLEKRWGEFLEYAVANVDALPENLQTRALADITGGETQAGDNNPPDDLSGLVVEEFLASQLVNVLDRRRRLFRRLGSFPGVRSGYARIPVITQHTDVDARAGQKQEANSQAMIVETKTFEAEWYDGAVDVAIELIRTAEIGIIDLVWQDLLGVYAKRVETATVAKVEAGGLGFTYTGTALDYTGSTPYADFAAAVAEAAIEVEDATDEPASKLGVPDDLWVKLVAATDQNDRRQFSSGDYSDATAGLTASSLRLDGDIEIFRVKGLTQAILFNEAAFRAHDYGPERVEAVNVAQMGRDLGVLGRVMWVPRIPAGVVVFGDDPQA